MTLAYSYDGSALAHDVAPSRVELASRAESGTVAFSRVPIEDPAHDLDMLGHRPFVATESACSQPRLLTGWVAPRDISRSADATQLVGDDAAHQASIVDANAALGFRIIWDTDGNRPEETMSARLSWLLASAYLSDLVSDTGFVRTGMTLVMDAADYRGSTPAAVLDDLASRPATQMNYFVFWDPDAEALGLLFDYPIATIGDCTLSVSNVPADVNGTTCFPPDMDAGVNRDPSEVYSDVIVEYANGRVHRYMADTATKYIRRGTTWSRPHIGKAATAEAAGDAFLAAHSVEQDRVTLAIVVPAASAGLVQAGQRISIKLQHAAPYEDWTWMRIVGLTAVPLDDLAARWSLHLELVPSAPGGPAMSATLFWHHSYFYGADLPTYGDGAQVVGWENDGDVARPGFVTEPLAGPLEYIPLAGAPVNGCYYRGIRALFAGVVRVAVAGYFGGVSSGHASNITTVRRNGTIVASDTQTDTFGSLHSWYDRVEWQSLEFLVEIGDAIELGVLMEDWVDFCYFAAIAGDLANQTHFRVTGTAFGEPGTGTTIPTPTTPHTTTHTTAPTATDDGGAGYHVGDIWIDTTTGEAWVIVDESDDAAVWVPLTPGAIDLADLADVTITAPGAGDRLRWDGTAWRNTRAVWLPLTSVVSGDPVLVWDDDDGLIPTEVPT